jgi:membrane fusion protein (multidrug efflux system)
LFSLLSNDRYSVVANFKETQIEHMKVGQQVHTVIEWPVRMYSGHCCETFSTSINAASPS